MMCAVPQKDSFTVPSPVTLVNDRYDPFAEIVRMALQKDTVLKTLADERAQATPNEAVIESCEIWLRVYSENSQRLAALHPYIAPREDA